MTILLEKEPNEAKQSSINILRYIDRYHKELAQTVIN
jgi:hypothetical protein